MPFYQRITDADYAIPDGVTVSNLYVVSSLEISVADKTGTGLALRLHSYPSDTLRPGYWAPPNLQYPVNNGYDAPQQTHEIVAEMETFVQGHAAAMREDLTLLAESFGLRGAVIDRVQEDYVVELKPSINQPAIINAFCTVRFALRRGLREGSEANLVDREGRHGFVLLPLDGPARQIQVRERRDTAGTNQHSLYFLGKPIMSGLHHILKDRVRVDAMRRRAIDVTLVETRLAQRGIVAVADVAGYGRVLNSEFLGLMTDPNTERREYQSRVLGALETALTATGTTQVQTAGDGFVAGYPTADDERVLDTLMDVIQHWTDSVSIIDGINERLASAGNRLRLGSRIALHFGNYEWGRINGMGSFMPAFNGPAIVDTARLEQGLNSYVNDSASTAEVSEPQHSLVLSDAVFSDAPGVRLESLEALVASHGWRYEGVICLRAKERDIDGVHLFTRPGVLPQS